MRISDWSSDVCSSDLATGPFGNWVIVPIYPFRFIFNRVLSRMGLFWLAIHPKHDKGTAASMDAWKGGRRLVPLPVAKNKGNSAHRRKVYGVRPIGQARSEERRVGKGWGSTGRSWRSPCHKKKNKKKN